MAQSKMKGIVLEIGANAAPLSKALDDINKKTRGTKDELKQVERLLRLDPTNTELLAQKQKILADSVTNARAKLEALKKIQEEFNRKVASGEIEKGSEQYREMERQVVAAEIELKKAQDAQHDFGGATKDAGKEAKTAGEEAEKAGKQAKNSGEEAKNGGSGWQKFGEIAKTACKVTVGAIGTVAAGTIALGKGIWNAANSSAESMDEIDKQAQKLGLSRQAYQEWDYVLSQSGVKIESLATGLKTLTNKLDDAKNGGAAAQAMFSNLGISLDDLQKMSREEVFTAAIKGFQGMADSNERAALANDLFGRSGQELTALFNESAESTQDLINKAHEYGMVLDDASVSAGVNMRDALDTLEKSAKGLLNGAMGKLLPMLTLLLTGLTQLISGSGNFSATFSELASSISAALQSVLSGLMGTLSTVVTEVTRQAPALLSALVSGLLAALPQLVPLAFSLIETIVQTILSPESVNMLLSSALQIVMSLLNGLTESLPTLITTVVTGVVTIARKLTDPETMRMILDAVFKLVIGAANGLLEAIPILLDALPEIISNIVTYMTDPETFSLILSAAITLFGAIIQAIPQIATSIIQGWPKILESIKKGLGNVKKVFSEIGGNLIRGLWSGIQDAGKWLWSKISGFFGGIVDRIKDFFGIHSPSALFRDMIGKNLVKGIAVGVDVETPNLRDTLEENLTAATQGLRATVEADGTGVDVSRGSAVESLGGLHFEIGNFINNTERDLHELMDDALEIAEDYLRRREGAFA